MSADLSRLLDKASHALRAAQLLVAEDELDAAVNRGYYAMFYGASALLARKGRSFRKHSAVQAAFGEHFAKTGELNPKYHRWLIDAFDLRTAGDYGVDTIATSEDAVALIKHAEEFLDAARRWLSGTISTPIRLRQHAGRDEALRGPAFPVTGAPARVLHASGYSCGVTP